MGWGWLPKPGEDCGPCKKACSHKDCAETRKMAASLCTICQKPMGYGVKYYVGAEPGTYDHALCVWEREEKRAKAEPPSDVTAHQHALMSMDNGGDEPPEDRAAGDVCTQCGAAIDHNEPDMQCSACRAK